MDNAIDAANPGRMSGMDIEFTISSFFGKSDDDTGLLLAKVGDAANVASVWKSMYTSTTWGEFYSGLTPEIKLEVENAMYDDDTPHNLSDPFDMEDLPGFCDGYFFAGWPPELALKWIPEDVFNRYGDVRFTPNGEDLLLSASDKDGIFAMLRAKGFTIVESKNLRVFLHYAYGEPPNSYDPQVPS